MLLTDLFEAASLPLLPKQIPVVRGSYGAFIVTMSPEDFLALTTHDESELATLKSHPFPYNKDTYVDQLGHDDGYGRYALPFLKVRFPSGKIFGHEGRHRSIMVQQAGGKKIPVVIYPYEENEYAVKVKYYDLSRDDDNDKVEEDLGIFNDLADAEKAAATRKAELAQNEDNWSIKTKIEYLSGGVLKGEPTRSEGWNKAAWRIEDFPKQLVGQYNQAVVVRNFRVGLVKGYRHHSR